MAATPPTSLCLSLSLDSALQPILLHSSHHPSLPTSTTTSPSTSTSTSTSHPFFSLHRPHPPTTTTSSTSHPFFSLHKPHPFHHFSRLPSPFAGNSSVDSPPRAGPFLDAAGLARLQALDKFCYSHEFDHGRLEIRPMEAEELDPTVQLLAESFVESMWTPPRYVSLLAFLVKQYVMERRLLIPHTAVLVGYYKGKDGGDAQLACTAEVSFDARGANASPPTPLPPKDCPYVCNITVKKALRRMGIGWELLKACEELISQMKTSRKVYLHCRVVDTGPLSMYKKAGYDVVKKDSILIWLTLQRRKYLMLKELPYSIVDHSDTYEFDDEQIR